MIIACLATYPPRRDRLRAVVDEITPQVDRLNIVLNEYEAVPEEIAGLDRVYPILPPHDLKDTGKFYPNVQEAEWVFYIDDDIRYPSDYVARTLAAVAKLSSGSFIAGYHGTTYQPPKFRLRWSWLKERRRFYSDPVSFRKTNTFYKELDHVRRVHQLGSGVAVLRGRDAPAFDVMQSSQRFVDIRLAAWAAGLGRARYVLPREAGWLEPVSYDETIYDGFTQTLPKPVRNEILSFVTKPLPQPPG